MLKQSGLLNINVQITEGEPSVVLVVNGCTSDGMGPQCTGMYANLSNENGASNTVSTHISELVKQFIERDGSDVTLKKEFLQTESLFNISVLTIEGRNNIYVASSNYSKVIDIPISKGKHIPKEDTSAVLSFIEEILNPLLCSIQNSPAQDAAPAADEPDPL